MGHPDRDVDVESLQKSGRRRVSCLDVFLVLSVIFLFVAVTAVAVGGVMVVMELRSKLDPKHQHPTFEFQTGGAPDSTYKMQNFAYVEAISSELKTSTMQWAPVLHGTGDSVGSNFLFDTEQHSLKPQKAGNYFIYIVLNVTCIFSCSPGLLSVHVRDSTGEKLTCEVQLPADPTPVSRRCWTVSQLDGHRLVTKMTVPENAAQNRVLDLSSSGLGMFLVD